MPPAFPKARAAVTHLSASDPRFAQVIAAVGPVSIQLKDSHSVFQSLATSILYQQLTGKAAATITRRFVELFGPYADAEGFPAPAHVAAASVEQLRTVGVSRSKALALRDLAAHVVEKLVPEIDEARSLDDETLIRKLVAVRGVGRWTVEMFLIFTLGRTDIWPVGDYGVRKGFAAIFGKRALPNAKQLMKHGEPFKPYRSVAAWYCWRALELPQFAGHRRVATKPKAVAKRATAGRKTRTPTRTKKR